MDSLEKRLNNDLVTALKSKDELKTETLRLLLSSIHNRGIEKRGKGLSSELSDSEVIEVASKEVKKRKEARDLFIKGGRPELAEKESAEIKILEVYLPRELSLDEVKNILSLVFARLTPEIKKDFGKVMGEAMKELKGKADSSLISRLVKEEVSKSGGN